MTTIGRSPANSSLRSAARPRPIRPGRPLSPSCSNEGVPSYLGAIRREAWDAHGGYEPSADVEPDVTMWLRLVAAGHDVRILPDTLVRIRIRPDSDSRDPSNIEAFEERLATGVSPGRRGAGPERARRSRDGDAASGALHPFRCAGPDRHSSPATCRPRVLRPAMRSSSGARCVPPPSSAGCDEPRHVGAIHPAKNRARARSGEPGSACRSTAKRPPPGRRRRAHAHL